MASVYEMRLIPDVDGIISDRIVVQFKDGVSKNDIDALFAANGYTVIYADLPTNYYVLQLPSGVSLEAALRFFFGRPGVYVTLPDFVLSPTLLPCDPEFTANPGQFTQVSAPTAWDTTQGDRRQGKAPIWWAKVRVSCAVWEVHHRRLHS